MTKVRKALFMFVDLFGLERYNYTKLVGEPLDPNLHYRSHQVRFLLTVKTNYRSVAYHNWAHGFHVANSIYSILKASPGIFTPVEVSINSCRICDICCLWSVSGCGLGQSVTISTIADTTTSKHCS